MPPCYPRFFFFLSPPLGLSKQSFPPDLFGNLVQRNISGHSNPCRLITGRQPEKERSARLSGVLASIFVAHIRKFFKMSENIVRF